MSPSMPSDIPSTPPVSPPKRVLTFRGEDAFSDAEEHPTVTLGYDFEDDQTRQQLELLDDLQKLGVSKYLDLPQVSSSITRALYITQLTILSWWSSVNKAQERAPFCGQ